MCFIPKVEIIMSLRDTEGQQFLSSMLSTPRFAKQTLFWSIFLIHHAGFYGVLPAACEKGNVTVAVRLLSGTLSVPRYGETPDVL